MPPHGLRRRLREVRQPLVAAPRGDDRKARGARPVDQLADQRRLVAIGEAVDHAGVRRLARQQRPAERVGLDRDVDHVLAVAECLEAMLDRSDRIARAFDDDIDLRMAHQRLPVVAEVRRPGRKRIVEGCRCVALRPASRRARDSPVHLPATGRRCRRDARLACSESARDTSRRTCRRRSARSATDCAVPRAAAVWRKDSCQIMPPSAAPLPACRPSMAGTLDSSAAGSRRAGRRSA